MDPDHENKNGPSAELVMQRQEERKKQREEQRQKNLEELSEKLKGTGGVLGEGGGEGMNSEEVGEEAVLKTSY